MMLSQTNSPRHDQIYFQLAWRHFWLHLWAGLAGVLLIILFVIVLSDSITITDSLGFFAVGFGFLGMPAAIAGLLRIPLMKWLFRKAQDWPSSAKHFGKLLVATAIIFVLPIVLILLAIASWFSDSIRLGDSTMFLFGVSLPWLLGSLWAIWHLRPDIITLKLTSCGPLS